MNKIAIFLFPGIFLLLFSGGNLYGQNKSTGGFAQSTGISCDYIKSYPEDIKNLLFAPVSWEKRDWLTFSGIVAGTGLLFFADEPIQRWSQAHKTRFTGHFSKNLLQPWGDDFYMNYSIYTMALLYGSGFIPGLENNKSVALTAGKAFLITALFAGVVKAGFGRHRPFQTNPANAFQWEGPNLDHYYSFVSGHSSTVWALATVLADSYEKPWVSVTSYSLAALVSMSRIHDNKHWATDVFAGAALGWSIGRFVSKNSKWQPMLNVQNQSLVPGVVVEF